ncbi:8-oxo-dGTP pyrophosphatase MutT (NUDIX family) [Natronocella acetinitrilica]|jgi:8-oxo-dGTP pyrophosphatase MutT (NUDIX family)|uniref:Phosphatase NudJ n=1 Tax=Natronocella acetinitrilica TaxID=414046 RepID=A0AAE3KCT6_9GAMM|nr:NUDIX hydrolase [Natronocella acetinitrilica]MCP1676101.1 8-oxo-dGTP pyrophosphatase MutT (NUDIX family) [Natronocella acetinitrilica]
MLWKPNVTVAAVIEQNDQFLFVEEHADGRTVLNQPAGHLEKGESLEDAVVREVLEETAYPFVPRALIGVYRWQHAAKDLTFLRVCFAGEIGALDTSRTLDADIIRALWLPADVVNRQAERLRSPLVARCVHDFQAGKRYPLDILCDIPDVPNNPVIFEE